MELTVGPVGMEDRDQEVLPSSKGMELTKYRLSLKEVMDSGKGRVVDGRKIMVDLHLKLLLILSIKKSPSLHLIPMN